MIKKSEQEKDINQRNKKGESLLKVTKRERKKIEKLEKREEYIIF